MHWVVFDFCNKFYSPNVIGMIADIDTIVLKKNSISSLMLKKCKFVINY